LPEKFKTQDLCLHLSPCMRKCADPAFMPPKQRTSLRALLHQGVFGSSSFTRCASRISSHARSGMLVELTATPSTRDKCVHVSRRLETAQVRPIERHVTPCERCTSLRAAAFGGCSVSRARGSQLALPSLRGQIVWVPSTSCTSLRVCSEMAARRGDSSLEPWRVELDPDAASGRWYFRCKARS
jgi:hypothetical protein